MAEVGTEELGVNVWTQSQCEPYDSCFSFCFEFLFCFVLFVVLGYDGEILP